MPGGPTGEFNTRVTYYKIRVYYLQIGRLANSGVFLVANLAVMGRLIFPFRVGNSNDQTPFVWSNNQ